MNASNHKKHFVQKNFEFQRKNGCRLRIEFLEQFMICAFWIKLTQLEQTGSTGKNFIPPEI